MKEEPVERVWVRWAGKVKTSVRRGWLSLQDGSNELIKRIVSSFQRFARDKHA